MPFAARVAMMGAAGGGVPLSDDLLPWLQNADVFMTPISAINWDTRAIQASAVYNAIFQSSGAQNAECSYDVVLAAGTWTFELVYAKYEANGIVSVQFDDVEKGTIDCYQVAFQDDVRTQITGIVVAASGKVRIKLKMATKNASATNYYGQIQHFQLKRTA